MKVSSSSDIRRHRRPPVESNLDLVTSTSSNKYKKYTKECTYLRLTNRNLLNYLPDVSSTSWFENKEQVIFPQTIQKIDDNGFGENDCRRAQKCQCAMCPDGTYYPQIEEYDGFPLRLEDDDDGFGLLPKHANYIDNVKETAEANRIVTVRPKNTNDFVVM